MVNEKDHTIVRTCGAQYRGLVEYALLAGDVYRPDRLEWMMKTSMLETLVCKHDSTVTKMADRHKTARRRRNTLVVHTSYQAIHKTGSQTRHPRSSPWRGRMPGNHLRRHDVHGDWNYTIPAIPYGDTTHANQGK